MPEGQLRCQNSEFSDKRCTNTADWRLLVIVDGKLPEKPSTVDVIDLCDVHLGYFGERRKEEAAQRA